MLICRAEPDRNHATKKQSPYIRGLHSPGPPLALVLALSLLPGQAVAQDGPETDSLGLEEALRKHRHPIRLKDGALRGEGGKMLREQAAEATVTVLGESHGTEDIPALMGALLGTLQARGELDSLALETSAWTTARMADSLQKGRAAYNRLVGAYPEAIPFYNLRPERDLIADFVRRSEKARPLWGLDQIFAFAGRFAFDRLETLAPSARAQQSIERIRDAGAEKTADDPRLQKLPPSVPTPITVSPPATFDTLRSPFNRSAEARALLDELSISTEIYRLNDTDNYRSNQIRARYLRKNLRKRTEQTRVHSEAPVQIAIKAGGFHAFRGITPNNALDVGNLATHLAQEQGGEAFNVAFLCGPRSEARAFPDRATECWPDRLGETFRALAEKPPDEAPAWLFELQALRPLLHEGTLHPRRPIEEMIWGLDAVVLVPEGQPAERIAPLGRR